MRATLPAGILFALIAACSSGSSENAAGPEREDSGAISNGEAPPSSGDAGVNDVRPNAGHITYTVEPFDYDGVAGLTYTVTQMQLHGSLCPCMKIPYPADGLHNQEGADAIWKVVQAGIVKPGDTLAGFSLGAQVISLFLSQHALPPGVRVVLLGDTFARNDQLVKEGKGVPPDIANPVLLVARQYDGWSDYPTNSSASGYAMAVQNSTSGQSRLHNYINVRLDHPANVVNVRGNITAIRIPTQHLPQNDWARDAAGASDWADQQDAKQRADIDGAYAPEVVPTPEQLAAATDEQVGPEGSDLTGLPESPEDVVTVP